MAKHAPGFWTASTISPILTGKDPNKLLVGGINYAKRIALERSGICNLELDLSVFSGNDATEWGNTYEAEAVERYEAAMFADVHGHQSHFIDGWTSCTPDGLIGSDGLVEIKCPYNPEKHFANLTDAAWLSDYSDQVQFQMMLTGRQWCDLVSYDPRFTEPHDLVVARVYRDNDYIELMRTRINLAEVVVAETLGRIAQIGKVQKFEIKK